MYIDTHCHLNSWDYDDINKVIENVGKNIIIVSGYDDKSNEEVIALVNNYSNIYGTIGIHPNEVSKHNSIELIENNLKNPKIVGVGEIGLDYHYSKDEKEIQKEYFKKQIKLAQKYNKAIVIHSRDAINDTYNILKEMNIYNNRVIIHAFSSSVDMANKFIDLGVMLGIGGVVTFKNGVKLRQVVENIDISHLLLETDSPYLTPEPYRGTKNEPKNVLLVAKKIAEIKDMPLDDILTITTKNALSQFDIKL